MYSNASQMFSLVPLLKPVTIAQLCCCTEPPPADEECPFCPEGLTVAPDFSLSTGDGPPGTCGGVVSLALKMNVASDEYTQARAVGRLCCPAGAGDDASTAAVKQPTPEPRPVMATEQ